jgi:hypothetical protein
MVDVPPIFYFGSVILLGSAYYLRARRKKVERVKRDFNLYTAVDDLSTLSEHRDRPKLSGTVVIIGGRFVHAVVSCKGVIKPLLLQPFRSDGRPCLLRAL